MREAVRQAIRLAHPDANVDQFEISARTDLAEELSGIAEKSERPVAFYSVSDADASSNDGSLWVVLSGDSALASDELFSFESSDGIAQSAQKFNRLPVHVASPMQAEKAKSLARFFLECCVRGSPGDTVTKENDLHHAIELSYIQIYGDVWRALEAGTQWWEDYQKAGVELTPKASLESGAWRVSLERLVLSFGMHPQLQQWDIMISGDGNVRVADVQSVFPKQTRWLSYAFRSEMNPEIH